MGYCNVWCINYIVDKKITLQAKITKNFTSLFFLPSPVKYSIQCSPPRGFAHLLLQS